MAYPSVTYTFVNATTASASEVNQNFTDLINGMSDGTKDMNINALTVAGTATLNGAVNLGNASGDDITANGYFASALIPKTDDTYDLGTAALAWQDAYFDGAVYTDTISELTSAAGVTIDSALLKDGKLASTGGTESAPGFYFTGDTDTGMWSDTSNVLSFSAGGIRGAYLTALGWRAISGAVATPSYSFISDIDSGVYLIGDGNIGVAIGGVKVLDISSSTTVLSNRNYTGTVTTATANTNLTATFSNTNYYHLNTNVDTSITCQSIAAGFTGYITIKNTDSSNHTITLVRSDAYVQGGASNTFTLNAGYYAIITVVDTGLASPFVTYVTNLA